jgi:hypothetical protein
MLDHEFSITNLPNYRIIFSKLPTSLYTKLAQDCDSALTEYLNPGHSALEMHSGLTGNGVPRHYYLKDYSQDLNDFILKFFVENYNKQNNILFEYKMLTDDVPLVAHSPWINIQKKHEFIPNHQHDGIISYVIWIKIPYDLKNEISFGGKASCFEYTYSSIIGSTMTHSIQIDKTYEGFLMMFPAKLQHCVYPFYTSEECRVSISGNLSFNTRRV